MPQALIAVGSNLGERVAQLSRAVDAISHLAGTQLMARSAWRETPPVGGPARQGAFLNGCVRVATQLEPSPLLAELQRIETALGRVRGKRWGSRTIDLDLLLYDQVELNAPDLTIPHPRMSFRRFVLEPAAEIAPWMLHPESGWTVAGLLRQLDSGVEAIGVAHDDAERADWLIGELTARLDAFMLLQESVAHGEIRVARWQSDGRLATIQRPKLLLAPEPAAGVDSRHWRRILHLPASGPVAWISHESAERSLDEALAAIAAAWPRRAP